MSKPALGKGLGALIPAGAPGTYVRAALEQGVMQLELARIVPNEFQPRKTFRDEALKELAASIKSKGVIQPVIVRKGADGGYQLVAGERRYRASLIAGLKNIPAIVKDVAPTEVLELALIENIQREDFVVQRSWTRDVLVFPSDIYPAQRPRQAASLKEAVSRRR